MNTHHCNACDYEWFGRTAHRPKKCPRCQSMYWWHPDARRLRRPRQKSLTLAPLASPEPPEEPCPPEQKDSATSTPASESPKATQA